MSKADTNVGTLNKAPFVRTVNGSAPDAAGNVAVSSSVAWGGITGTLANQTDLNTALGGKSNTGHTHGAADLSGVVKTINSTAPDGAGNVVISGSGTSWGGITGTLSSQTDLYTAITTMPQNSQSAAYTLVLGDANKHIYHPSSDTTARTWTIPANASVAFQVGTAITFVNDTSGGAITIAITSDTLVLAGAGTTGSRTLAANGIATAVKVASTRWLINGTGLS